MGGRMFNLLVALGGFNRWRASTYSLPAMQPPPIGSGVSERATGEGWEMGSCEAPPPQHVPSLHPHTHARTQAHARAQELMHTNSLPLPQFLCISLSSQSCLAPLACSLSSPSPFYYFLHQALSFWKSFDLCFFFLSRLSFPLSLLLMVTLPHGALLHSHPLPHPLCTCAGTLSSIPYSTVPFLCLVMVRYTNTCHGDTDTYSIQYGNMLNKFVV